MTAVDWLISKLPLRYKNAIINDCKEEIQQAKEMEKVQIIKATLLDLCWEYPMIAKEKEAAEKYYNDTYKTEVHDK